MQLFTHDQMNMIIVSRKGIHLSPGMFVFLEQPARDSIKSLKNSSQ